MQPKDAALQISKKTDEPDEPDEKGRRTPDTIANPSPGTLSKIAFWLGRQRIVGARRVPTGSSLAAASRTGWAAQVRHFVRICTGLIRTGATNADSVCQGFESCISVSISLENRLMNCRSRRLDSEDASCVRLLDAIATPAGSGGVSSCVCLLDFARRRRAEPERRGQHEQRRKRRQRGRRSVR
jgi:hypothetical protein